mmetsp:Transcript_8003/g.13548  ORF Transcript_8003/g.13548 Transcript_8003/m.13548 type:complete len:100 (-) Transcript_8003:1575-1874(-)
MLFYTVFISLQQCLARNATYYGEHTDSLLNITSSEHRIIYIEKFENLTKKTPTSKQHKTIQSNTRHTVPLAPPIFMSSTLITSTSSIPSPITDIWKPML